MRNPGAIVAFAAAIAMGAAWPWLWAHRAQPDAPFSAPISIDYLQRDATIAFYESRARLDSTDQITRRMLGGEYLQRFRETGDLNDVTRAAEMAKQSLRLQPGGNIQALSVLASSDLAVHRFEPALVAEQAAVQAAPFNDDARAQTASILMELGRYEQAARILSRPKDQSLNPT
ncbi:MAG: hypothetical protein WAK84_13365, partial [Candidatus Cybelea sp.]